MLLCITYTLIERMVNTMKYKKDKKKLIQVRMAESDLEALDAIAASEKRTRSDVIRMLIVSRGVNNGQIKKVI